MTEFFIAAMTFSILRAPYGDALVQEFDDRTPAVFDEAEAMPGFIRRAKPMVDKPWMTNFQKDWGPWGPFAVPRFYLGGVTPGHSCQAQTLSLWRDLTAIRNFAYWAPLHRAALADRGDWFGPQDWPIYCLWWVTADHQPTWREACLRLEYLHDHGPTLNSFTMRESFDPQGWPTRKTDAPPDQMGVRRA